MIINYHRLVSLSLSLYPVVASLGLGHKAKISGLDLETCGLGLDALFLTL